MPLRRPVFFKEHWPAVANSKVGEHMLIVLPNVEKRPRRVFEQVAVQLREQGHTATTLSAAALTEHPQGCSAKFPS